MIKSITTNTLMHERTDIRLDDPTLPPQTRLQLAVLRGALDVVADAASVAKAIDPNWIMEAVDRAAKHRDSHLREPLLHLLAPHLDLEKARPIDVMAVVYNAIGNQAFEGLPTLYALGFRGGRTDIDLLPVSDQVGRGQWPYPDLFYPDLLTRENGKYCERTLQGLFRAWGCDKKNKWFSLSGAASEKLSPSGISSGLTRTHLKRLMSLEMPDDNIMAREISSAYAQAVRGVSARWLVTSQPEWEEQAIELMQRGWLREDLVRNYLGDTPLGAQGFELLAEFRYKLMDQAVDPAVGQQRPGPRI